MPEIVVTGLGATTPLGGNLPDTWAALLAGTSGVGRLGQDWAAEMVSRIGAQALVDPATTMEPAKARHLDRAEIGRAHV
jgi:3-oxoacyl-[acyl-carrier-protein] synthase II